MIMKHTPYGYDIVGGAAVINEEQAANLRKLCENYPVSYTHLTLPTIRIV